MTETQRQRDRETEIQRNRHSKTCRYSQIHRFTDRDSASRQRHRQPKQSVPWPEHPEEDGSDHREEIIGVVGTSLLALSRLLVVQHPEHK